MNPHLPPTTLITGATFGIGNELAKIFAEQKHTLVLVARNKDRLHAIAKDWKERYGIEIIVIAKDLADPKAPESIFQAVQKHGLHVDNLVNNAGFGLEGRFASTTVQRELEMIQVNIGALVHLTKLFLPGMLNRKHGRIMNVASTAAFQPGPHMSVYYATKAFVLSFSEALNAELKRTGVTVTALCPGPTHTEFQSRAGVSSKVLRTAGMKAFPVAEAGYRGMMRGKRIVIPGLFNRIGVWFVKFAPRPLPAMIIKRLHG